MSTDDDCSLAINGLYSTIYNKTKLFLILFSSRSCSITWPMIISHLCSTAQNSDGDTDQKTHICWGRAALQYVLAKRQNQILHCCRTAMHISNETSCVVTVKENKMWRGRSWTRHWTVNTVFISAAMPHIILSIIVIFKVMISNIKECINCYFLFFIVWYPYIYLYVSPSNGWELDKRIGAKSITTRRKVKFLKSYKGNEFSAKCNSCV